VNDASSSEKRKVKVLFVDDENNILHGLRRNLRYMHKEWDMDFAEGGEEALAKMSESRVDVLVSDMRMPGMDGIELLTAVREQYPHTIRFLLSGYSDQTMILKSVGLAHQFFNKPCKPEVLVHAVSQVVALNARLNQESVQNCISKIRNLPSPPHLYQRIRQELNNKDCSLDKLADLIEKDASTTAKVLQLVNSAFFGMPEEISSVRQALMLLGIEVIKSLVLMVGFSSDWRSRLNGYINPSIFSDHSLMVANLSRSIAADLKLGRAERENAFSAGLLHDLGKLILASINPREYGELLKRSESASMDLSALESQHFGASHAVVGAYLLNLWGLPFSVVETAAYHHEPLSACCHDGSATGLSTMSIVHLANGIVLQAPVNAEEGEEQSHLLSWELIDTLDLGKAVKRWKNEFTTPC